MSAPWNHLRIAPVLGALLIVQIAWIGIAELREDKIVPLKVGQRLPYEVKPLIRQEPYVQFQRPCRVAFACSRDCAWCAKRADRYVANERDTLPQDLRPLWLITADSAGALAWAEAHDIAPSNVMALMPSAGSLIIGRRFGHIWFSPMRLVVRSDLTLRDARPVDQILGPHQLTQICESGGMAPQSIEEFLAMMQGANVE